MTRGKIIYGQYFFLSDSSVEHQREVYNILNVLATFGGLANFLVKAFGVVGTFINTKKFFGKFIRTLYFEKTQDREVKKLRFSFFD